MVELVIGEIEQMKDKYRFNQNLRDYLRRIKRKTALLIAASCQLVRLLRMLIKRSFIKLAHFGYYVGMSYQIIDDILDFTATEKELGNLLAVICFKEILRFLYYLQWKMQAINSEIIKVNENMTQKKK